MSKKANRNKIKQYFITFPKSNGESREQFAKNLPETKYIKVVEESHKDESKHLHAILVLENPMTKVALLKHIRTKYAHDYKRIDIQPVRSIKHSVTYLDKEDREPYTSGSLPRRKLKSKTAIRSHYTDNPGEYYTLLSSIDFGPIENHTS